MNTDSRMAAALFRAGDVRLAITRYRKALRFEADAYERAVIYLELARVYRIAVRMKNARLELRRCAAAAGLSWPGNSWLSLIVSWINPDPLRQSHPDLARKSRVTQICFVADLYEEIGLSAYYLRQVPTLLQAIIRTGNVCRELGPSRSLLNWYGGAACIWSLMGFRKKSLRLIRRCHEISTQLPSPAEPGKALIWEALLSDYNGQPMRSAELFEECLNKYGDDLQLFDFRLSSITLSINYLARGHYQKALDALSQLSERYPRFAAGDADGCSLDSCSWHSLAPKAMLGQVGDVDRMVKAFRSILSVDKDEKWLLAQFLGHLLIAGRQMDMDANKAEDLIKRFEILGMPARRTHLETSFYWIAAAYIRFDAALADATARPRFRTSLAELGKIPGHPTSRAHHAVLKAGSAWLAGNARDYSKWSARAGDEARRHDNRWALVELDKLQSLVTEAGGFH